MRVPAVGETATRSMLMTDDHIESFAKLSGDRNPLHFNDDFARSMGFPGHIAHGMLTSAILGTLLGMDLPGPGTVFLEQRIRYLAPVRPGDTLTGEREVTKVRSDKPVLTIAARVTNQDGTRVLDGEVVVLLRELRESPA